MNVLSDLLKIFIPSSLVLVGMYLVIKNLVVKELQQAKLELKNKSFETVLPLKLQASERLCLFLERNALNNLVLRVNEPGITVSYFHQKLLKEIRNEYNHNLAQQLYVSSKTWSAVKLSVQDITLLINNAVKGLDPNAKSIELAKKIFDEALALKTDPTSNALQLVKAEVQQFF